MRLGSRLAAFVPGWIVLGALYLLVLAGGGRFLHEERLNGWGYLDLTALQYEFWPSITHLHMQPPLLNFLAGLTLGDAGITRLTWLYALAASLTVALVVDTLVLSGIRQRWAALAGAAYALLPSTVIYAFFPYNTTLTALFAIAAIWGIARARTTPVLGVSISALGATGLFTIRASFVWVVVLAWIAALAWVLFRRSSSDRKWIGGAVLGAMSAFVLVVQGHYLTSFQSWTLSTWSSENIANGMLRLGLTEETKAELAAQDPCFADLITGAWQPVGAYQACLVNVRSVPVGASVLDQEFKSAPPDTLNYNFGLRRAIEPSWAAFVRTAIREEPLAFVRLTLGTEAAPGTIQLFLGRSDDVYTTLAIQKQASPAVWNVLGVWSAVFPWVAWILVIAGAAVGLVFRSVRPPAVFWWAAALLVVHAGPSVLGEYGENARFRAEMDSVLIVAAVIAVGVLMRAVTRNRRSVDEGITTTVE